MSAEISENVTMEQFLELKTELREEMNIYRYYGAGVPVCDRQPSVRRVIRLKMCQHATTGLSNRMACRWRPVPMLSIYHIRYSDNN
jgi:hypothetical protein